MNIPWEASLHIKPPRSIFSFSRLLCHNRRLNFWSCSHYFFKETIKQARKTSYHVSFQRSDLSLIYFWRLHQSLQLFLISSVWVVESRFWQVWWRSRLAALPLNHVWVMKAIKAAVTLTCQAEDVYCQLQLCPSPPAAEVLNPISTCAQVAIGAERHLLQEAAGRHSLHVVEVNVVAGLWNICLKYLLMQEGIRPDVWTYLNHVRSLSKVGLYIVWAMTVITRRSLFKALVWKVKSINS